MGGIWKKRKEMKGKRCGFDGLLVQRGGGARGGRDGEESGGGPQAFGISGDLVSIVSTR